MSRRIYLPQPMANSGDIVVKRLVYGDIDAISQANNIDTWPMSTNSPWGLGLRVPTIRRLIAFIDAGYWEGGSSRIGFVEIKHA
jgi:hypothetical protein